MARLSQRCMLIKNIFTSLQSWSFLLDVTHLMTKWMQSFIGGHDEEDVKKGEQINREENTIVDRSIFRKRITYFDFRHYTSLICGLNRTQQPVIPWIRLIKLFKAWSSKMCNLTKKQIVQTQVLNNINCRAYWRVRPLVNKHITQRVIIDIDWEKFFEIAKCN